MPVDYDCLPDLDIAALVRDLNAVVSEMYSQDDEVVEYARRLLAVLRRHQIGE